jgi:hypothetical protein
MWLLPSQVTPEAYEYAAYEPAKIERAALRWFSRYLGEGKGVSLFQGSALSRRW